MTDSVIADIAEITITDSMTRRSNGTPFDLLRSKKVQGHGIAVIDCSVLGIH
jgi:hypothetical protein